jgi:hypothetical protein
VKVYNENDNETKQLGISLLVERLVAPKMISLYFIIW